MIKKKSKENSILCYTSYIQQGKYWQNTSIQVGKIQRFVREKWKKWLDDQYIFYWNLDAEVSMPTQPPVSTEPLHHKQDMTQSQFLIRDLPVRIQSFSSPRLVA